MKNFLMFLVQLIVGIFIGINIVACSDSNDPGESDFTRENQAILLNNPWVLFYNDASGIMTYTFKDNGSFEVTYADNTEKISITEFGQYSLKNNSLNIKDKTYEIVSMSKQKIQLKSTSGAHLGDMSFFWNYSDSDNINKLLIGEWEDDNGWYEVYHFNNDYSYQQFRSYYNEKPKLSESGYFRIENTMIRFMGEEDGTKVNYSLQLQLIDDEHICLLRNDPGHATIKHPLAKVEQYSHRTFTEDSPYFEPLTNCKWIERNSGSAGSDFQCYTFDKEKLSVSLAYYTKKGLDKEYNSLYKYKIEDDVLTMNGTFKNQYLLSLNDGKLQLKNTTSSKWDMMYPFYSEEDFYKANMVGKWVQGSNHITFFDNMTYERTYEHFLAENGAWESGRVSMDFVYVTLTYDDYWDKEEVEGEGHYMSPSTYCVVLDRDYTGEIKLKLTDIGYSGKVYLLSRE